MLEADREEFTKFISAYIGRNAEAETIRRWWNALKQHSIGEIKSAFILRDREKGGYPEPRQIIERIQDSKPRHQSMTGPAEDRYWFASDLLCASRIYATSGANTVAALYDSALALRVTRAAKQFPDLAPEDAVRETLRLLRTEAMRDKSKTVLFEKINNVEAA